MTDKNIFPIDPLLARQAEDKALLDSVSAELAIRDGSSLQPGIPKIIDTNQSRVDFGPEANSSHTPMRIGVAAVEKVVGLPAAVAGVNKFKRKYR